MTPQEYIQQKINMATQQYRSILSSTNKSQKKQTKKIQHKQEENHLEIIRHLRDISIVILNLI